MSKKNSIDLRKKNKAKLEESEKELLDAAQKLEMTEDQKLDVEKELEAKSTGFESHAKQEFATSPFKPTNAVEGYGDENYIPGKDPERAYKLIDYNKFRNNGFRDNRGWLPLTQQTASTEQMPDARADFGVSVATDGFWHVGDRIWAFMPRAQYVKIRQAIRNRTQKRTESIDNKMLQTGESLKRQGYGNLILKG